MGFRVLHHEGDKELLFEKVKEIADQLKNHENKDCFDLDEGEWERAVDSVANGDFSDTELAPFILSLAINDNFPVISEDYGISADLNLADRTSGKLAQTLRMFVEGRNFSTGNLGFGTENSCGYLTSDEVKEFLELLKAHTPVADDKDHVDGLIDEFSALAEKNSGDLFIMS